MPEQRRRFSPQFKAEAVQMVLQTGRPIVEVAGDLGINEGTLGNWVTLWRRDHPEPEPELTPVERARVKEMEDEIRRLRMENEFLKKSRGLLRPDAAVAERCALIEAEKATYPVAWMCRLLDVPRSSFYAWRHRIESPTRARRRQLAAHVQRVFDDSRQTSGSAGHRAVEPRRARVQRRAGRRPDARARPQGRATADLQRTTQPGEAPVDSPDLLGRDVTATELGTQLVGDITYLKTGTGWLYLAIVIDLATRMVVGWQLAPHMRTSLVLDALAMARDAGHVRPGAIFHSDRGAQYTSTQFARFCTAIRVRTSVGRTGVCWDNAIAESFFAALKNQMYYRRTFATQPRARFAVAEYIEIFHNRQRLHSTLGYRTPIEALIDYRTAAAAA
jgi:putative transposase